MFLKLKRSGYPDSRLLINSAHIVTVLPRASATGDVCEIKLSIHDDKGRPIYYLVDGSFEVISRMLED